MIVDILKSIDKYKNNMLIFKDVCLIPFLNFSKAYVNLIFVVDSDFIGVTSVCSRIDTNVKCYVLVLHFAFLQGL